ncbi:helix-turn-helix transcriptional regulator [Vibrio campbellii]|uniref:helix-turn-helix transcriptional regulator n=1 Tax=Vibrio campbellii TaxID=680 RepID=UPI003F85EB96
MTLVKKKKAGRPRLSIEKQNEIKKLIKEDYTYQSIAVHLGVSLKTVQNYSRGAK